MDYDFSKLSPNDFESLARDLIGRAIGVRFEAFTEGPDGGIDGRYVTGSGSVILQVKHYHRSPFSGLKTAMTKERSSIDRLQAERYVLTTSMPLTPGNKASLASIIGPTLVSMGDIFGADDIAALLRQFADVERAHPRLWSGSTTMLETVVSDAVQKALAKPGLPPVLAQLLPKAKPASDLVEDSPVLHDVIFLLKASPSDDEFALWLAPKLEAEGYRVFADMLTLQPGDRWRREINAALQYRAVKVLLVCKNTTLEDPHVLDDLEIALDVAKERGDKRFIIPLRLESFRKIKGLGDAVPVDFVRGWGEGLALLLEALKRQKVPRSDVRAINPNWEIFRRRGAIPLINEPERLTSNWLRVVEAPDDIHYYESRGFVDQAALKRMVAALPFPAALHGAGFLSFASEPEVAEALGSVGRFETVLSVPIVKFVEHGSKKLGLLRQPASNIVNTMIKEAWFAFCRERGLLEYHYSGSIGFHASPDLAATGQRIPWGRQGSRRSSMLRNTAKGHIWQFGVTALPTFWPFWHLKLKSRVLFATDNGTPAGLAIDDAKKMHRLRRTVCKGWRNKQWHGRMLAFLELLSGESAYIRLPLSASAALIIEASPILFSSPVSTTLPDILDGDDEEADLSTLGRPESDEDIEA
jgi:hypothetical protein